MNVDLSAEEQEAMDAILVAMNKVRGLSRDGNPANFIEEVVPAVINFRTL